MLKIKKEGLETVENYANNTVQASGVCVKFIRQMKNQSNIKNFFKKYIKPIDIIGFG